ncbi:MAG: hypothetical protein U9N85_12750 [Bacteroidota bacterium]|nr:hypothetical protein [Bacteroidota bacterium]
MQKILLSSDDQTKPTHEKILLLHKIINTPYNAQQTPNINEEQRDEYQHQRVEHKQTIQKVYQLTDEYPDLVQTELDTDHEQLAKNRLNQYMSNEIRTQSVQSFLGTVANNMSSRIGETNTGEQAQIDTASMKLDDKGNYSCNFKY